MIWKRTARWSWLILPFLLLALWPARAAARESDRLVADAVLYEVWENVFPPTPAGMIDRVAAIAGSAKIDTPVCAVVKFLNPAATSCAVTAVGTNHIQLGPDAQGNLVPVSITAEGDFKVVIEADNPFDSPEGVATTGRFAGTVFPLPLPPGTRNGVKKHLTVSPPLLGIVGTFTVDLPWGQVVVPFSGTFRLPFGLNEHGEWEKPRRGHGAFYLSDSGRLIRVRSDEFSLGFPTVRLEVTLGH
jgi:hypothetical protein